jgi:hypothetical protein
MKNQQVEKITIGTMIGRRRVTRIEIRGKTVIVDVECTCPAHTVKREVRLMNLIRGQALSCGCWTQELRAAEQIAWERFRSELLNVRKPMHVEREKIQKRFFPWYRARIN